MPDSAPVPKLPAWAAEIPSLYESSAVSQFILHGNVHDRIPLVGGGLGTLGEFLVKALLPRFDVVLSYDLGYGLRVEQGGEVFQKWPRAKGAELPREPRAAVELASHYLRYLVNLARLGTERRQAALIVRGADLVAPAQIGSGSHELSAMVSQMRDWASDGAFAEAAVATFLLTPNLNDLHPLLATNPRAARIKVPLPDASDLAAALARLAERNPAALGGLAGEALPRAAASVTGATLSSIEQLVKVRDHQRKPLAVEDFTSLKKGLVEQDCEGLIDFIDARRSLADVHGQEPLKAWLKQDFALWAKGDLQALPMGYLLCGPVGTGKTFMVECLAGEAGVPVVKLKNFRDKWVGSTEGNLEKIFRLIHALGRVMVFIDEADQALGKRGGGDDDSGIGGRVYAMIAQEMSDTRNRGRILWVLASSRPDLIEVDLKRPGRIDVKIPLLPTGSAEESWRLIRALAKRRDLALPEALPPELAASVPLWLTPGAAEALSTKVYRLVRTQGKEALPVLADCLRDWQPPVRREIMEFQIRLALNEATDLDFVPEAFRAMAAQPAR